MGPTSSYVRRTTETPGHLGTEGKRETGSLTVTSPGVGYQRLRTKTDRRPEDWVQGDFGLTGDLEGMSLSRTSTAPFPRFRVAPLFLLKRKPPRIRLVDGSWSGDGRGL